MEELIQAGIVPTLKGTSLKWGWWYRDENGERLGCQAYYGRVDGRKLFCSHFKHGDGRFSPGGRPTSLFGLDRLDPNRTVFITEGEKKAEALWSLGFCAVSSFGGAEAASKSDWSPLQHCKRVIILPDNDPAGKRYAAQVCDLVPNSNCTIVSLRALPEKGDVIDWIQQRIPDWDGLHPIPDGFKGQIAAEFLDEIRDLLTRTEETEQPTVKQNQQSQDRKRIEQGNKLRVVEFYEFLAMDLPVRKKILGEWLLSQSINMIYAKRGVGKTHVALGCAYAIASGGSFFGWECPQPRSVLYLDGEMPGHALQERLQAIGLSNQHQSAGLGKLRVLTPDLQPDWLMPDLSTPKGQQEVLEIVGDSEVIIVDNLSCLARTGKENEAEGWMPMQEWVLGMRRRGKSVILIHHAGKGGAQRGTSKREDILDVAIRLEEPADYSPTEGAVFEVHFEKARHLSGDAVAPFKAKLKSNDNGDQVWEYESLEENTYARVIELSLEGLMQRDIAEELGKNKSTISRYIKRAKREGRIRQE